MLLPISAKHRTGFTLIEFVLYMGIASIVLSVLVRFGWDIILVQTKAQTQLNLTHHMTNVSTRLAQAIQPASAVTSISPTALTLIHPDPALNPTVIDYFSGQIRFGYGLDPACPATVPCPLTAPGVVVESVSFTNLGTASYPALRVSLTFATSGQRSEWQDTYSFATTLAPRSAP